MSEEQCADCRIAITTKGVEIDSSQGDLLSEAVLLGTCLLYTSPSPRD